MPSVESGLALYQAILDAPDDDTPRMVYADWLDDVGEARRAEFLRVQCRIALLSKTDGNEYYHLALRERELFDGVEIGQPFPNQQLYWREKVPPSIAFPGFGRFTYHRGFVASFTCSLVQVDQHMDALRVVQPLRQVLLDPVPESRWYESRYLWTERDQFPIGDQVQTRVFRRLRGGTVLDRVNDHPINAVSYQSRAHAWTSLRIALMEEWKGVSFDLVIIP